jgi:hypothetical protein
MSYSQRFIATPAGNKFGDIFDKFQILGISSYLSQTGNLNNERREFDESFVIEVPVGTFAIVPVPNWSELGHGTLDPEYLDTRDPNSTQSFLVTNGPWAEGDVRVSVSIVNPIDHTQDPPVQTAVIRVLMRLIDNSENDPWFGFVGYTLIFLGRSPIEVTSIPLRKTT